MYQNTRQERLYTDLQTRARYYSNRSHWVRYSRTTINDVSNRRVVTYIAYNFITTAHSIADSIHLQGRRNDCVGNL